MWLEVVVTVAIKATETVVTAMEAATATVTEGVAITIVVVVLMDLLRIKARRVTVQKLTIMGIL